MKKMLLIFSICSLAGSAAFSQDDIYYTGDQASVTVKAQTAPPALPVYVQPQCPVEGYLWSPGYWAWAAAGYYWVPGVWVRPPHPGVLWTPGYWGFFGGYYGWHGGYWGPHVGFYGGVNYGYGYGGSGFYGGRWEGGVYRYNTAVVSVNTGVVHNTYVSSANVNSTATSHASFNGPGGIAAKPTNTETQAMNENHVQPTTEQQTHQTAASNNKAQYASANNGKPATTSMNSTNGQHFSQEGHAAANTSAQQTHSGTGQPSHSSNTAHPKAQHAAPQHGGGGGKHGK